MPDPQVLRSLLRYEPDTGRLFWKIDTRLRRVGDPAERQVPETGYLEVSINGIYFRAHRLIYAIVTGQVPPDSLEVDHRNGDRQDNRWTNLRLVTKSVNQRNQHRAQRYARRTSRYLGVDWRKDRKKWRATIFANSRKVTLGHFDVEEDAAAAYMQAKLTLHADAFA